MRYRLKNHPACQIEVTKVITIKALDPGVWSLLSLEEQFPIESVDLNRFEPMYFETYLKQLEV